MDAPTQQLVDYALGTNYETLTGPTIHACKLRLVDTFACALGAMDHPLVGTMRTMAARYRGGFHASLWGTSLEASIEMAAFANGIMVRVQDYSDTYLAQGGGHPSDIIAGLVAAAEAFHASGRDLIAATVVGYEIYCRLMEAVDLAGHGWDQPVQSVLATAVGAGMIAGLSREQLGHAIALALTPNMALRQTRHGELSSWKGCAGANAARNALFAVLLAREGLDGPSEVFTGRQGLWSVTGKFDWPALPHLRENRMIGSTHLKNLPVCYHDQSAAECALELNGVFRSEDIVEIRCESYKNAVEMTGSDPSRWAPSTSETADHSMPFIVATALAYGRIGADAFAPSRLRDPSVVALMHKVTVTEDPLLSAMWPAGAPTRITLRASSGARRSVQRDHPRGHGCNPMSEAEVSAKFRASYPSKAGIAAQESTLSWLWSIDASGDLRRDIPRNLHIPTQPDGVEP